MSFENSFNNVAPHNTIPEYFSGKVIFMTGGTGFIGKVLIEKLLRSCPDISKIYILIRPKRGFSIEERLEKILNNSLFDLLRKSNSEALNKIEPIIGDIAELGLGISEENRNKLINNVNIVYHIAATIKFNEPLEKSVILNIRGTREICKLSLTIKKLLVFNHVSTAYCQLDKYTINEQLYPSIGNWENIIEMAESMNPVQLKIITSKLAERFPNTYTFTKSLAESAVRDLCEGKISTIIYRPTIVVAPYYEPIPGWTDNLNGPNGLCIATLKGLIRVVYCQHDSKLDCIPADIVVAGFIKATWMQQYLTDDKMSVYNCSSGDLFYATPGIFQNAGIEYLNKYSPNILWYPNLYITQNIIIYYLFTYLFHVLPALLLDFLLYIWKKDPIVMNYQRKIQVGVHSLEHFIRHEWYISNKKFLALDEYLQPSDCDSFQKDLSNLDPFEFTLTCCKGVHREILHEDPDDINIQKKNAIKIKRMKYITYISKTIVCFIMFGMVFKYILMPGKYAIYKYLSAL